MPQQYSIEKINTSTGDEFRIVHTNGNIVAIAYNELMAKDLCSFANNFWLDCQIDF